MRKIKIISLLILVCFLNQCKQPDDKNTPVKTKILKKRVKPAFEGYHYEKTKDWAIKKSSEKEQNIVMAVNRTDKKISPN